MFAPSKTLVIRFSSVGDVVLSTPLLRILRQQFPKTQIDYLTKKEFGEIIRSNQNVNITHEYDPATGFAGLKQLKRKLKNEKYDLVVDIHNSLRSRYIRSMLGVRSIVAVDKRIKERTLLVKLKKNTYGTNVRVADRYIETVQEFGVINDGKGPELHIPDGILSGVSGKIAKLRLNRYEKVIGLCPFARHSTKEWPWERFAELGTKFISGHEGAVMLFGGREDRERSAILAGSIAVGGQAERVFDWAGEFSLLETAAAMQYCDVIVSNDTGLMHMANAIHRKLVGIFGSTVEEFGFFPTGNESVVLERRGLYCRPCSHIGLPKCPEKHFRCMKEIEVTEVFAAVETLLNPKP